MIKKNEEGGIYVIYTLELIRMDVVFETVDDECLHLHQFIR